jgi:hypothetical protein
MKTQIRIRLEIDVTGTTGNGLVSDLVNAAILELVNRKDFREGSIQQGRVIDHTSDFQDKRVTIDFYRLHLGEQP